MDWKSELGSIVTARAHASRAEQESAMFSKFLDEVVFPALTEVADELKSTYGRDTRMRRTPASLTLVVRNGEVEEISFCVLSQFVQAGILPKVEVRVTRGQRFIKQEGPVKEGAQKYTLADVTGSDVIACFIKHYRQTMEGGAG